MILPCYLSYNTTRLGAGGAIIEIAAYAPDRPDGRADRFVTAVRPAERLRPDAGALLNLPPEPDHLRVAPELEEALLGLAAWLPGGALMWVGHRIKSAVGTLKEAGLILPPRVEVACYCDLHRLAHHLLTPDAVAFGTTPQVLARVLALEVTHGTNPFRAQETVLLLREIHRALRQEAMQQHPDFDQRAVIELSEQPIQYLRLPGADPSSWFAPYRGWLLSRVPGKDLINIADRTDDEDLRWSIQNLLGVGRQGATR